MGQIKNFNSDCWAIQGIKGITACRVCKYQGKRDCGGNQTLLVKLLDMNNGIFRVRR